MCVQWNKVKLVTRRIPFQKPLHRGVGECTITFHELLDFTFDTYLIILSVKLEGIKYHFFSLWYGLNPGLPGYWQTLPTGKNKFHATNPQSGEFLPSFISFYSLNRDNSLHFCAERIVFFWSKMLSMINYVHIYVFLIASLFKQLKKKTKIRKENSQLILSHHLQSLT